MNVTHSGDLPAITTVHVQAPYIHVEVIAKDPDDKLKLSECQDGEARFRR